MDFGLKSESNDFARKTPFACTYAETNPYPLENSFQIWILDRNLKAVILPGTRILACKYAETKPPPPWKIVPKYGFWIEIWNQWFCQENAFYMYICRNQTPPKNTVIPKHGFWIEIWNQWFCQENAIYMYICRNQTPTPWKIVSKYGFWIAIWKQWFCQENAF